MWHTKGVNCQFLYSLKKLSKLNISFLTRSWCCSVGFKLSFPTNKIIPVNRFYRRIARGNPSLSLARFISSSSSYLCFSSIVSNQLRVYSPWSYNSDIPRESILPPCTIVLLKWILYNNNPSFSMLWLFLNICPNTFSSNIPTFKVKVDCLLLFR